MKSLYIRCKCVLYICILTICFLCSVVCLYYGQDRACAAGEGEGVELHGAHGAATVAQPAGAGPVTE